MGVGSGVLVSVAVEVGGLVGVSVGGRNSTVWVCAASAVSKIMVSTAPGAEVETDGAEEAGSSQASRAKRMLSKDMSPRFAFFFIRTCMEYHLTVIVTETLHRAVFFLESTQVEV